MGSWTCILHVFMNMHFTCVHEHVFMNHHSWTIIKKLLQTIICFFHQHNETFMNIHFTCVHEHAFYMCSWTCISHVFMTKSKITHSQNEYTLNGRALLSMHFTWVHEHAFYKCSWTCILHVFMNMHFTCVYEQVKNYPQPKLIYTKW